MIVCSGTPASTGNATLGIGGCLRPNLETRFFRNSLSFNSQPCLVTYNFTADNAFRIYVNGVSSPTNMLPGNVAGGVCGTSYSGNNWNTSFSGTIPSTLFATGNNPIEFETVNGTAPTLHPFWLSGNLIYWQFNDLNADFYDSYEVLSNGVKLTWQLAPQSNGIETSLLIEYSITSPASNWTTFYTSSPKFRPSAINSFIVPALCDEDGVTIRVTTTVSAGSCVLKQVHTWSCNNSDGGGSNERFQKEEFSSNNNDFELSTEEILDYHLKRSAEMAIDFRDLEELNLQTEADSVITKKIPEFSVMPNPSTGKIRVKLPFSDFQMHAIKIFNQFGAIIFDGEIFDNQEIDISQLPDGIYYIKSFNLQMGTQLETKFCLRK